MKWIALNLTLIITLAATGCSGGGEIHSEKNTAVDHNTSVESTVQLSNRDKAVALLNSFNTGDQTPISYINPEKYIQHNLAVGDGLAGFGEVMKAAPPQGFSADVVRSFEDGDFVFTHTVYDFFGPKVGFDIFRFEDGLIVEHWDVIETIAPEDSWKNNNGKF